MTWATHVACMYIHDLGNAWSLGMHRSGRPGLHVWPGDM
jgi:hypothetical protein